MKRADLIVVTIMVCFAFITVIIIPAWAEPRDIDNRPASMDYSQDGLWHHISHIHQATVTHGPRAYRVYGLHKTKIMRILKSAPMEFSGKKGKLIFMPLPDGTYTQVRVQKSHILSPKLQAQYPDIQTYIVQGEDDGTMTGRLGLTPAGFHAVLISTKGIAFVNPKRGRDNEYLSYWKRNVAAEPFRCGVSQDDEDSGNGQSPNLASEASPSPALLDGNQWGDKLRTYRLAINANAEFTEFVGGETQTLEQIITTVNHVTAFYEREVSMRFQLVHMKAFTDPATDPFTDGNQGKMTQENQIELDETLGTGNYDIGHVFAGSAEYGGATNGFVCESSKARGVSTFVTKPLDEGFYFLVAHELGHMLGASHTFSECSVKNQFVAATAYEVGSGCSLMGYGNICGYFTFPWEPPPDDPPPEAYVNYFHSASIDQIITFTSAKSCGTVTATGKTPPWIGGEPSCTTPRSTPLVLRAWNWDPTIDPLIWTWEQMDAAPSCYDGYPWPTATSGPLFISFVPSVPGGERHLPALSNLVADKDTPWEVLPAVDRKLHFRATARDNHGGVSFVSTEVNIAGAPLWIALPTAGLVYECGADIPVLWAKGGSLAPNMVVGFDAYDGNSYSGGTVGITANDGSYIFRAPMATEHARVRLDPDPPSCYFAYSKKFSVVDTMPPIVTAPPNVTAECTSPTGTPIHMGSAVAIDACDGTIKATNDAPNLFPLGSTYVMWKADDRAGNRGTDLQDVTVKDTIPPTLVPPPNVTVECTGAGTPVNVGTPKVSDVCDASVILANDAPALFPVGSTAVNWTATDHSGNKATGTSVVTVKDTIAPTLSCNAPATITPSSVPVSLTGTATDICKGTPPVTISVYTCYGFTPTGKKVARECIVQLEGSKITILDSGGIGTNIDWTIFSDDGSGNQRTQKCHIAVVKKR